MSGFEFNTKLQAQYEALTTRSGFVDFSGRTQIEITGADRATFLHNLCTNDITSLAEGSGCEAYLTSVQGKVLAHAFVFSAPASLILESASNMSEQLLTHLDRYLITEDVQLIDRTQEWRELLLSGPDSIDCLRSLGGCDPPVVDYGHCAIAVHSVAAWVRHVPILRQPTFLLGTSASSMPALIESIRAGGAVECAEDVFHSARIESRFPWFPLDVNSNNLPQEAARDEQTISFTKGCYLGQETVARLDALGHVNRLLTGLKVLDADDLPELGSELVHEGKVVGRITSAAFSPTLQAPIAFGMVRRALAKPATRLGLGSATAEVINLPIGP